MRDVVVPPLPSDFSVSSFFWVFFDPLMWREREGESESHVRELMKRRMRNEE